MLFLLFHLGKDRYALDASQVAEILPLVDIKQLPHAPLGVAGVFDCRGLPVPVLDLSQIALGRPAPRRLSTRLIVVRYPDERGETHLLGLIAERVTATLRREPSDFVDSGITNARTPYLGKVTVAERGLVQRIDVGELLPMEVRELLFRRPPELR
jgi:chemotaxis-related protein WspB